MKKLVFLTGAGMSAESGISTFRDAGGLWDRYPVMDVCSADGFERNPALVHEFYNKRRRELATVTPNPGHCAIAALESDYDTYVITQNVDNLHERAGSSRVLHLHGELMKVRSLTHPDRIYELSPEHPDTTPETRDSHGDPVRPHIVFFQEAVPMLEPAIDIVSQADILVIIGTSLNVYPAAGLLHYAPHDAEIFYIDPHPAAVPPGVRVLPMKATEGMVELTRILTNGR